MFQNIVIATDGSKTAATAARTALDLAKLYQARVFAVYVMDVSRVSSFSKYAAISDIPRRLKELMLKTGTDATNEIKDIANAMGLRCDISIVEGKPADELLRLSKEIGADLIVLGSVGTGGIGRFILGSVAEKVVEHSTIPVLVVPGFDGKSNDKTPR